MNNDVDFAKELLQQHKSQRRWLVAFACVSFLVLIIIIFVSLVFIDSDYINNLQNQKLSNPTSCPLLQVTRPKYATICWQEIIPTSRSIQPLLLQLRIYCPCCLNYPGLRMMTPTTTHNQVPCIETLFCPVRGVCNRSNRESA